MPATVTTAPPKPGRTFRLVFREERPDGSDYLGVLVKEGKRADGYYVTATGDDMQIEVRFAHETDPKRVYTVSASHDGRPRYCTCPSRVPCRHRALVPVLVARGLIRTDR